MGILSIQSSRGRSQRSSGLTNTGYYKYGKQRCETIVIIFRKSNYPTRGCGGGVGITPTSSPLVAHLL